MQLAPALALSLAVRAQLLSGELVRSVGLLRGLDGLGCLPIVGNPVQRAQQDNFR